MRRPTGLRFAIAGMIFLIAPATQGATAKFKNGDRLTGEVVSLFEGRLILKTEHAGEVAAEWSEVVGLQSEEPVTVYITSGPTIRGTLLDLDGGWIGIKNEKGIHTVALPMIAGLNKAPKALPEARSSAKEPAKGGWKGEVEVGTLVAWGNIDDLGTNAQLALWREMRRDQFRAMLSSLYGQIDQGGSAGEQTIALRWDHGFRSGWYAYGIIAAERDEMEDLDLRVVAAPGIGRVLSRGEHHVLSGELGIGGASTDPAVGPGGTNAEANLALRAEVDLPRRSVLSAEARIFPNLSHTGDHRLAVVSSLDVPLSERLAFTFSVNEYVNTDALPGVEKSDLQVRTGISLSF